MARRRANGEGTIYRRKDGRYEAALWVLTTSGAQKRIRRYGDTRAEAHEKLVVAKLEAQNGVPVPDRMPRLGDYLDYWLEEVVRPSLRRTTYSRYELSIRRHIKPELGKYQLARLSVPVAQAFFGRRLADGQSVRNVHVMREVLSSALSRAIHEELLTRNVARLVKLPSYQPDEIDPWTTDEAKCFLEACRQDPLYPAFVLLLLYGLRLGEVLGLRWCDVDFVKGLIRIEQQLQRTGHELYLAPVKTKSSKRELSMVDLAYHVLSAQHLRQAAQQRKADGLWKGSDTTESLVFTTSSGLPVEPRNLSRSFHRIREQSGLRRIRVHDLRHANATFLKDVGVPDRDVQAMLGHSDTIITRRYQHGNWDTSRQATTRIADLLQGLVVGETRSRQLQPSKPHFVVNTTSAISGRGDRDRTCDLRFWSSTNPHVNDRILSVRLVMQRRTWQWLLGAVAVKLSRQETDPPPAAVAQPAPPFPNDEAARVGSAI